MTLPEFNQQPCASYNLDHMMEALLQGRGDWVYANTWPLAEEGSVKAQLMMGILYQIGNGVPQNGNEAVRWYRAAAEQNDVLAWKNLGTLFLLGLAGVAADKAEAHHCFSKARALEIEQTAHEFSWNETVQ